MQFFVLNNFYSEFLASPGAVHGTSIVLNFNSVCPWTSQILYLKFQFSMLNRVRENRITHRRHANFDKFDIF